METYKGKINEFVDWVSAIDSLSENKITDLPISGESIRKLILKQLRTPFVYYEDINAGLFRLFSSEDAKNEWLNLTNPKHPSYNPELASSLELFSFVRPGDTAIGIEDITSDPRYIISGDNASEDSIIKFWVSLKKEQAGQVVKEYDAFVVTYTIKDSMNKETVLVEPYLSQYCNNDLLLISKDVYLYLTEGTNTISINVKAQNSSAYNSLLFSVYLVRFELSSSFNYAIARKQGEEISIPVQIKRSISNLNLYVNISILDGTSITGVPNIVSLWETSSTETTINKEFKVLNTYPYNSTSNDNIKHTIRIEAYMLSGNNTFRSNVLFYNFETAAPTEIVNSGIINKFINIAYDTPANKIELTTNGNIILQGVQYSPFVLNWAYYTDLTNDLSIDVLWALRYGTGEEKIISNLVGTKDLKSESLVFIPSDYFTLEDNVHLLAIYNNKIIGDFPIIVAKSSFSVRETSGMVFKIDAYGRSNSAPDARIWRDSISNSETTFSFNTFDNSNGWNNNTLTLSGEDNYAIINFCPIPSNPNVNGKTIEFEFRSEKVSSNNDIILTIGSQNAGHIDVTPNAAYLRVGDKLIVQTNFKANEDIKLAFIFNKATNSSDPSNNLVFIVNNGILERAADADVYTYSDISGRIKIGGSKSGICFKNMRIYDIPISTSQALDNRIYDATDKASLISRNEITIDGKIDYELTSKKIDTILIEGNLDLILTKFNGKSECTASVRRNCVTDKSKNFYVDAARLRKHGLSTLNYPIVSLKIWTNKSNENGGNPVIELDAIQSAMNLAKNRYIMKDGAIPANKFVLLANYADSSGVHNGGLLRLINDTWFNAVIDGQYRLRTAPLLFSTDTLIIHNDTEAGEDGWIEGYGSDTKGSGKLWKQITGKDFPYQIRTAPDSFACAVFYKNTGNIGDDNIHFLGQYVFMDDKKSDYCYGERSIYSFGNNTDPFALNIDNTKNGKNGKLDVKENRVWNNKDVLRVEVVLPNYELTSYMNYNVNSSYTIDENGEVQTGTSSKVPCDTIKKDSDGKDSKYYWEDFFDLTYPDPDDIEEDPGVSKFDLNSKFNLTTAPFLSFLKWITDCKLNYTNSTNWWSTGTYSSTQQAFEATAAQHLDLYKLAAYYIFFLRFGLVDSVERNAQVKTYDGLHWHYEPWDMDIALGNTNQGQLAFDPPMTRDSLIPGTANYAFSGRSSTTSNVLWDCLEAWDYWANTIVPKVAKALYKAGLTYDNITKMFDEEYVDKWSETIYNESGYFKYIENGGGGWLAWLQGSRTSHRHWWLSTSMNYYDAKWSCGEFEEHRIALFADKVAHESGDVVTIKPTSNTFFKFTQNDGTATIGTKQCDRNNPALFDISDKTFSAKDPSHIYGSTFVEEIDISCLAKSLNSLNLSSCYDKVLGAPVKVVNVGIPFTDTGSTVCRGFTSNTKFSLIGEEGGNDALANLETLDVTGLSLINGGLSSLISSRKNIKNLYAIGTGITAFQNASDGNKFDNIKLPSFTVLTGMSEGTTTTYLNTLQLNNASWKNFEFWSTLQSGVYEFEYEQDPETGEMVIKTDEDGNQIFKPNVAIFTKTTIPALLLTLKFKGSTASNPCAGKLLLEWLRAIENQGGDLSGKTFEAENINWGAEENPNDRVLIYYSDLEKIAKFNRGFNANGTLKGYIRIADTTKLTTTQLSNLREWFGETVFDLTAKNSRLVIDLSREYVLISVGGVNVINDELYLEEPNAAILSANKFMLGTDNTEYNWVISTTSDFMGASLYATVFKGDDGITRLITSQSTSGNYSLYIKVWYIDYNTNNRIDSDTVKINIIAVTYPNNWIWELSNNIRLFKLTESIAKNIFGIGNYSLNNVICDTYILYTPNTSHSFKIYTNDTSYTASLKNITYRIINNDIDGNDYIDVETVDDKFIVTTRELPSEMKTYKLEASIEIGGLKLTKRINIIIFDDNEVVLYAGTGDLFTIISNTYKNDYNLEGAYFDFYKSHLLSIYGGQSGTIDFSTNPTISSLATDNGYSIFKYLENITSIKLDGNININSLTDNNIIESDRRIFNFDNIKTLNTLIIKNNPNIIGTLDLSQYNTITSVDLSGTPLGIKLPTGSPINNLVLGSPSEVSIIRPRVLTDLTIESSVNLTDIELIDINIGDAANYIPATSRSYNIFDTLVT